MVSVSTVRLTGGLLVGIALAAGVAAALVSSAPDSALAAGVSVIAYLTAFACDVAVAVLLFVILRGTAPVAAAVAAAFRIAYVAIVVTLLLQTLAPLAMPGPHPAGSQNVAAFERDFTLALSVFGIHLAIVGWLLIQSRVVAMWLAWAVMLAGGGYVLSAVLLLVAPTAYELAHGPLAGLALSELFLAIWLLVRPRAFTRSAPEVAMVQ